MGILAKHSTNAEVQKFEIQGSTTLYLSVNNTVGKVIFIKSNLPEAAMDFKAKGITLAQPRTALQVKGFNIFIMFEQCLNPPEKIVMEWEIERDIGIMCEWYRKEIEGNKSICRKHKIK